MRIILPATLAALALPLAACSQETQDNAAKTADYAAQDAAKNLDAAGEALEDGAADAAREVSAGAADLEDNLRDGDAPAGEVEEAPRPSDGQRSDQ